MTTITDGSAQFAVIDKRMKAMIDMFYPVGSVYFSADPTKTKSDFVFMEYGTWEEIEGGRCLEVADSLHAAGSTVDAGLPNITGTTGTTGTSCFKATGTTGVFSNSPKSNNHGITQWGGTNDDTIQLKFDASAANPIYGASDTVQPPAYFVKAWRRTA